MLFAFYRLSEWLPYRQQAAIRIVSGAGEEAMLGAVKGDPEGEDAPLFRLLARKWKSLAPLRRERASFLSKPPKEELKQARSWIEKPRNAIYAHQKIDRPNAKRAWNPWLWVK